MLRYFLFGVIFKVSLLKKGMFLNKFTDLTIVNILLSTIRYYAVDIYCNIGCVILTWLVVMSDTKYNQRNSLLYF
jgi:hypothetical protein